MKHYLLVDANNHYLRDQFFEEAPDDPVGKGWRWVPEGAPEYRQIVNPQAAAFKARLADRVDGHIAAIYAKWLRFEIEYTERETAARAYRAAGYVGEVSEWISRFANNNRLTAKQAADLIIAQADGLRSALKALGNLRMDKYLIIKKIDGAVTTQAEAQAKYDEIIAQADAIAAMLP